MNPHETILGPVVTEKSTGLADTQGTYAFRVPLAANKVEIRKAVEHLFRVHVTSVNTMKMRGKKKRVRLQEGKTPDWKKALVTLRKGEKIDLA